MGVPKNVLAVAGFLGSFTRRVRRGARRAAPVVAPIARRPVIKTDELEAGILALDKPFSVKDVSEEVGGRQTRQVRHLSPRGDGEGHGRRGAAQRAGWASRVWRVAAESL